MPAPTSPPTPLRADRPILTAGRIGTHARSATCADAIGQVTAVFYSVIYVSFGANLVAVTSTDIAPGGLNLTTNAQPGFWLKTGLKIGQSSRLFNGMLYIGGSAVIDLSTAQLWRPLPPIPASPRRLMQSLNHLGALKPAPPTEGYGQTIHGHDDPDIKIATLALEHLNQGDDSGLPNLKRLLGRGPGLTPAGDDFLGGAMIALHAIGQPQLANKMWAALEPGLTEQTGPISAALLTVAADGTGSASLHRVIHALLTRENLDTTLAELDQIGHSSGWDAFAGVVLAIRTHATCAEGAMA